MLTGLRATDVPLLENLIFVASSAANVAIIGAITVSIDETTPNGVEVIVDSQRKSYAQWGLGVSSFWHVLSPRGLWAVYRLGTDEGIWNRSTESGNRWQSAGSFAVNRDAVVKWSKPATSADDIPVSI